MQGENAGRGKADEAGSRRGVAINETEELIASDKVEGTPVYNRNGESLGSICTVMIDTRSGRVRHAVMSFGGFLGIGERYHPLPWDKLSYDVRLGGYVVDVTREQLEGAPSYARNERPWGGPLHGQAISGYYGLPFGVPLPRV